MREIKMIMMDMDGTLLTNDDRITETTKQALMEAKKQGIVVGIASGRASFFIDQVIKEYGLEEIIDVASGMNGAHFVDYRRDIHIKKYPLSGEYVPEIVEKCKNIDTNIFSYDEFGVYAIKDDEISQSSSRNTKRPLFVTDFAKETNREWNKLVLKRVAPFTEEEFAYLYTLNNDKYHGFQTANNCFEIVNIMVSKSRGIGEIAESYGFTLSEVLAFGDSGNDIDMLTNCGIGVCMANGTDDAKAVADYITLSNEEDGIAAFIYKHIIHPNFKCVMLDLDGTLFDDSKNISEYTKEILRKLHDRGIKIGIATGRPVSTAEKKVKKWGLDGVITLIVGMNGGNIKNLETNSFTCLTNIPKEAIESIIDFFTVLPIEIMISDEEKLYMENYTDFAKHIELHDELEFVQTDFSKERHLDWPKLCVLFEEQYREAVIKRGEEFECKEINSAIGSPFSLEFMGATTNKGWGLNKLCEEIGIPLSDVMAIGDNDNDIEMLKEVGIPVCMINGGVEVKKFAKYITQFNNNEDGVARHLRWYI